jgi:hypothetical protein
MFSQLITLYITPVIYTYLEHLQAKTRSLLSTEESTSHSPLPPAGTPVSANPGPHHREVQGEKDAKKSQ